VKYVIAVDQSTSGTKALLIDESGAAVRKESLPHRQFYPAPGYVEHDAEEIFQNTLKVIAKACEGINPADIASLAVANQRETTVLWDRATGRPLCHALVWQDVRAEALCRELADAAPMVLEATGLMLSPYYSAAKAAHAVREYGLKDYCFGTVDSFLVYRLTGGKVFATDISNASRTQLMNLNELKWDAQLCDLFGIPESSLPEIRSSDADFGFTDAPGIPEGIRITGLMGDSHASLYGQGCHEPGMVKTSYGTGSSIMMNVGSSPVRSTSGLSSSVGYGAGGKVCYVLEGNITCSADTLIWLRDQLELFPDLKTLDRLAETVPDAGGVSLVPAFSGLGAPYFDTGARAILYGMSRGTTRAHVARAALESIAQQNADVLDAMAGDLKNPVTVLSADGGGSVNQLLMQMQADLVPCRVKVAAHPDLTAMGVGLLSGLASGVFDRFIPSGLAAEYAPQMPEDERKALRSAWADAVRRTR
jgi:glycerol kinase